jgi:hypothetical protein
VRDHPDARRGGERSQTITALEQVLPQPAAQGYVFERLCL